jgi:hypothetical protein
MTDESDGTIVLELADVVGELTRRHSELLGCLRSLREDLHGAPVILGGYEPPPPRVVQPPQPRRGATPGAAAGGVATASPVSGLTSPSTANAAPAADTRLVPAANPSGSPRPQTKRHYDYFAELDDLLARLPASPSREETDRPLDH